MQKRMVRISSAAILAGIFVTVIQTCMLYFLESPWIVLVTAILLDLGLCQYLLENSFSFNYCFRYLMVVELFTLTLGIPAWFGIYGTLLPWSPVMVWLYVIHLAVPFCFCTVRYLADYGPRFMNYNLFFLEFSLLLWPSVVAGFLYFYVYKTPALTSDGQINLIPFYSIASLIEAYIQEGADLRPMIFYLLHYGAFFLPAGFYLHLLFGRRLFLLRILCFLLLPAAIEAAQYFFRPAMCEIDDLFPAFLGCIVGSILFSILNHLCQSLHEEDFLHKRNRTSFYF